VRQEILTKNINYWQKGERTSRIRLRLAPRYGGGGTRGQTAPAGQRRRGPPLATLLATDLRVV